MCAVIVDYVIATQTNRKIVVHRLVIKEVLLNHCPAIPEAKHKVVEPKVGVQLHNVPKDGSATDFDQRLRTILRFFPQPGTLTTAKNYYFQWTLSDGAISASSNVSLS
jgi:hypothetical protein